jgi:AcrR family transcriptional regulator
MQDVIAEAGLSVGAVYRYFKSKQELVTSIAEQVFEQADAVLGDIAAHEPPLPLADAVERAIEFADRQAGPDGVFRIAVQVWAESLRDPELAVFVKDRYSRFRRHYAAIARRAQEAGELPPDADVDGIGAVLFGMVPAYALQRVLADGPDKNTYAAAVRTLLMR